MTRLTIFRACFCEILLAGRPTALPYRWNAAWRAVVVP